MAAPVAAPALAWPLPISCPAAPPTAAPLAAPAGFLSPFSSAAKATPGVKVVPAKPASIKARIKRRIRTSFGCRPKTRYRGFRFRSDDTSTIGRKCRPYWIWKYARRLLPHHGPQASVEWGPDPRQAVLVG